MNNTQHSFNTDILNTDILLDQHEQDLQGQSNQSNSGPTTPNSQTEEEPLYVNAKQYNRILKRRQARNKLENEGRIPKVRMVSWCFLNIVPNDHLLIIYLLLDLSFHANETK